MGQDTGLASLSLHLLAAAGASATPQIPKYRGRHFLLLFLLLCVGCLSPAVKGLNASIMIILEFLKHCQF